MTVYTCANGGQSLICLHMQTIIQAIHSNSDDRQMECLFCTQENAALHGPHLLNKLCLLLALVTPHTATLLFVQANP